MLEKLVEKFVENRKEVAVWAAIASTPVSFITFFDTMSKGVNGLDEATIAAVKTVTPLLVYQGIRWSAVFAEAYLKETDIQPRTRFKDYHIVRELEKTLQKLPFQEPIFKGEVDAPFCFKDLWVEWREIGQLSEDLIKKAYYETNPHIALRVIRKYLSTDNLDDAFSFLNDTTHKFMPRAKFSFLSKVYNMPIQLVSWLARKIYVRDIRTYIFSAFVEAILNPSYAWYYSKLGCMVADEFGSPFRNEMFVFHALLASAQGRSDVEEAWADAVAVMREDPVWERMGDTRCVVRRLQNSKFFANAFVFKERGSLDKLVEEASLLDGLRSACPDLSVPEPLHVSAEPFEGRYCLVTRFLSGPTLYECLCECSEDLDRIIPAIASIHACFNPETVPVSLEDKISSKFDSLDAGYLADKFTSNAEPLFASLHEIPWFWSKDAHPENWIVSENIGVIDCEGRVSAPCMFDLANLLEYDDYLSEDKIRSYVFFYVSSLQEEGVSLDSAVSLRAYYNAVIYRMICLAGAWNSPERIAKRKDVVPALDRAVSAVHRLSMDAPSYYERYKSQYVSIEEVLVELKNSYVS